MRTAWTVRGVALALHLGLSGLLVLALPSLSAPAHGQQDVIKLADRLNKKAMEDYDNLEFDSAKQTLQGAIAKLREAGLDETPSAARIYLNLGIIYFLADRDRNRATNQFVEALKIDGTAQLDPERATPELQDLFGEAQKKLPRARRGTPPPPAEPSEPSDKVHGIVHSSVDEARAGQEVLIKAQVGSDVAASRLFLFYRPGGQEDYVMVPMVRRGSEFSGAIPGAAMVGRAVQYYIEARDQRGRPAVASGSAVSPYIISISASAPAARLDNEKPPGLGGDELPAPPTDGGGGKKRGGGRRTGPGRGGAGEAGGAARGFGRLFVNLMVGAGLGVEFAGNQYEVAYKYDQTSHRYVPLSVGASGLAFSPLHGALELGVNINRHVALSLIGRLEGTLLNNADSSDDASTAAGFGTGTGTSKAGAAAAGLLRFRYTFGEGRLRPGLHLGLGGGQIRHVLDITSAGNGDFPLVDSNTASFYTADPYANLPAHKLPRINQVCLNKNPCYDNIALGFLIASVGGSLYYDLTTWKNGGFGVIVDAALMAAFGQQTGLNLDLQIGVGAHFL